MLRHFCLKHSAIDAFAADSVQSTVGALHNKITLETVCPLSIYREK